MSIRASRLSDCQVLVVVLCVIAYYVKRETRAETGRTGQHPTGHYMSQGMAMGVAFGAAIGAAMDNIAIGIPIGIASGAGVGSSREKKHAHELRPMTEKEKVMKRRGVGLVVALLIVTALIAVGLYSFKS